MATSTSTSDYFNASRPAIRTRPPSSSLIGQATAGAAAPTPTSPRTPLLGRSISSQFGSPSTFRTEQDDHIIYELGARHLSAGFAGESAPRCIVHFHPDQERRLGDFRAFEPGYRRKRRKVDVDEEHWGSEYELYRSDLRTLDLGLVEDRLERLVRTVHVEHLQLDQKPRKAVLVVPSLFPTPLLEIALKVLFNVSAQPPSTSILTTPLLACVGAGLRNALVVDIGWEETVVTAVGEYKEVSQRRSVRARKLVTREMARLLQEEFSNQQHDENDGAEDENAEVGLEYAEDVIQRMAWCRSRPVPSQEEEQQGAGMIKLPPPSSTFDATTQQSHIHIPFTRLSKPAEIALFTAASSTEGGDDDHDTPVHKLAYRVLLSLPPDFRALCLSRIVLTGGLARLPGLKTRLLQELEQIISTRGWDVVEDYGSSARGRVLRERSANTAQPPPLHRQRTADETVSLSPTKKPLQEAVPHSQRIHDDTYDLLTQKVERETRKGRAADVVQGFVRGVETLGAWSGASLLVGLKVKAAWEVEREEFVKHGGLREEGRLI